jgi:DNA-binding HxlR family transcriptional regulator
MSYHAPLQLLDLIQSHRITAVIYVAAKLGIPDLLLEAPRRTEEIARSTGSNQAAITRLLYALCTIGICERTNGAAYSLTVLGTSLAESAQPSVKAWAIFEGEMLNKSWSGLLETIKTGKTAAELRGFVDSFDMMARSPENVHMFNRAMADLTRLVTADVVTAYDFSRFTHLLDVGGGSGELLGAVLMRYPHLRGAVFDLDRCSEVATNHLREIGCEDRATFIAGDFFESVPAVADAIILKSVIHDWNNERSQQILRNCRRAIPVDGTLLLAERLISDVPSIAADDRSHALSDLNMMRGPGGLERTSAQYEELLKSAGFQVVRVVPAGRFSVIEAKPAVTNGTHVRAYRTNIRQLAS